ncbi:GNAT family N-acetyltransferase [Bacillus salipaludis]|uniref:GNAT family N-acetyltransferase n=1 Tax=Bacillus salipaludis TaxID=2547811 RepID=A0A4V3AT07_9BACI|nr:GNAT family N-acetyltransferase [Bacillus salipaludis]MDQ6596480.1 GNAT family N-acetyltransferase [Bacillus salipaludis]TDK57118.1 GNAT family N-acetyltransferase [Bacillus salipaludis]
MNRKTHFFWSEMYYQPKLTYILKNLCPSLFDELGKKLEIILGYPIEVYVNNSDKERWTISFNGHGIGSSIRLILYVYDPSVETFGAADIEIINPTVEIVDFVMHPKRKGLGTKVINQLIDFIEDKNWGFEIMILKAQDLKAASFWSKVGFTEADLYPSYTPSMTRPFIKKISEPKMSIKISYQNSFRGEKVIISQYDLKTNNKSSLINL